MSESASVAYEKARAVLDRACSPLGRMASPEGYPHIRARDRFNVLYDNVIGYAALQTMALLAPAP